jgi:hypothetical protein
MLDVHKTIDHRHLRADAQFAEELAIRYGDALRRIDGQTEGREKRIQCMTMLFDHIAALHGVNTDEVKQAASQRDASADFVLVFLPMALVFLLFSYRLCNRIFETTDSRVSAAIRAFVTSILISACGVLVGEMWALAIETLRIGNGHLSFRTARIPWSNEREHLFSLGLVLFWVIAYPRYRRRRKAPTDSHHDFGTLGLK